MLYFAKLDCRKVVEKTDNVSTSKSEIRARWKPGAAVLGAALAVYYLTLSRVFYPVESAHYVALHLGLWPFPPLSHALWGACIRILNLLPGGAPLFNAFSGICAALALMLIFVLTVRLSYSGLPERYRDPSVLRRSRLIAGFAASAALGLSVPFWFVATRAHVAAFDLMLLLWVVWLLVRFHETRSMKHLLLLSFFWGLAVTEYPTMILLSAAIAPALAVVLWRAKMLNAKTILPALGCFILSLGVYVVQALLYIRHPAFQWQELTGFFQVLWFIWREQYLALRAGMGANGWIMILISMLVPALSLIPNTLSGSRTVKYQWTHFLLYSVFVVLAAVLLFNIYPAPWPMVKLRPLLVLPYAVCAVWMGYLAGILYAVVCVRQKDNTRFALALKKSASLVFVPLLAAVLGFAAVLNYAIIDSRPGDRVAKMASGMVRALDSQTWLITDGLLDANLALSAAEQGIPVNLLNVRIAGKKGYLNYAASLFSSPRLQGLARIGIVPLLKEWMQFDDASVEQVAIATDADLWRFMGKDAVPDRGIFKGMSEAMAMDAEEYFSRQQSFWTEARDLFAGEVKPNNMAAFYWYWARSHLSKVANNSGVHLHDLERPDLAAQAYRAARRIDPDNLSAMLNLHALAGAEKLPEFEALNRELETFIENMQGKYRLDRLSAQYGMIRDPRLFVQRGLLLAASGQASAALYEMEKVAERSPASTDMQMILAGMYGADQQPDRSAAEYARILEREPENARALSAMVQLSLRRQDPDAAEKYLNTLSTVSNVNPVAVQYQRALVDAARNRMTEAMGRLRDVLRQQPDNLQAGMTLMLIAQAAGDTQTADETMNTLTGRIKSEPRLALSMAVMELQRRNYKEARAYLEGYIRNFRTDLYALDLLLRLDAFERRKGRVEEHVEQILSINPRHAFANYMLGTLQVARGELALAEESYRVSLSAQETPEAMNDLAWLLQSRGAYEEALDLAYRSLAVNDRTPSSWDTYAMVLKGLDRLLEAEEAINMALGLQPNNPVYLYHLALIQEGQGDLKGALQTARPLLDRAAEIPPETFDGIRDLMSRLPQ
ncbi:MAG TPA: DUF2723 domain-containing protein [Kiritimatiellia bacterium]|nr:DUF2723 domain-containing protein [Kiritimatiellia bacterium]